MYIKHIFILIEITNLKSYLDLFNYFSNVVHDSWVYFIYTKLKGHKNNIQEKKDTTQKAK